MNLGQLRLPPPVKSGHLAGDVGESARRGLSGAEVRGRGSQGTRRRQGGLHGVAVAIQSWGFP